MLAQQSESFSFSRGKFVALSYVRQAASEGGIQFFVPEGVTSNSA